MSGKKFNGPEFVQKHIFNKHGGKVEEVKMEVRHHGFLCVLISLIFIG
jgi:hypothetical protein